MYRFCEDRHLWIKSNSTCKQFCWCSIKIDWIIRTFPFLEDLHLIVVTLMLNFVIRYILLVIHIPTVIILVHVVWILFSICYLRPGEKTPSAKKRKVYSCSVLPHWLNKVIPWWRHQMETISALLALASPVNSPHKGQWRGALTLSLICAFN